MTNSIQSGRYGHSVFSYGTLQRYDMKAIKDEGLGYLWKKESLKDWTFWPKGILREHGKCLFFKNGLPGENVEYQITVSKKKLCQRERF